MGYPAIYPQSADEGVTPTATPASKQLRLAGKLEGVSVIIESGSGGSYTIIVEQMDEDGEFASDSTDRDTAIEPFRVSALVDGDFTAGNYNSSPLNAQVSGLKLTYSDANAAGTEIRFVLHMADGGADRAIGIAT